MTVTSATKNSGASLTAVITQSNYIPWKGYFEEMVLADKFVFYDDVQYTRRDWRNRNRIKTNNGLSWLTIPVEVKGKYSQNICDTKISDPKWNRSHWEKIKQTYGNASGFKEVESFLSETYLSCDFLYLSEINHWFITRICEYTGIQTKFEWSSEYAVSGDKSERLAQIAEKAGATMYLSGPAAKAYMDESVFKNRGIAVSYMDYNGYPEYPQINGPFEHSVSIIDMLCNIGMEIAPYMKYKHDESK